MSKPQISSFNDSRKFRFLRQLLLLAALAGAFFCYSHEQLYGQPNEKPKADAAELRTQKESRAVSPENRDLAPALREFRDVISSMPVSERRTDYSERAARAYLILDDRYQRPVGTMAKELPRFAKEVLARPDASPIDRANAFFVEKKFVDAEKAALEAKNKALAAADKPIRDAIQSLMLAGDAADNQYQFRRAVDHYQAVVTLASSDKFLTERLIARRRISLILQDAGSAAAAADMAEKTYLEASNKFGPEDEVTLILMTDYCESLYTAEKYDEFGKFAPKVYELTTKKFGVTNLTTIKATQYYVKSLPVEEFHKQVKLYDELVKSIEKIRGPKHFQTLAIKRERAMLVLETGGGKEMDDAIVTLKGILQTQRETLGPDHLDTVSTLSKISLLYFLRFKPKEALPLDKEIYEKRKAVLGEEHFSTYDARRKYAMELYETGDIAGAKPHFEELIVLAPKLYGVNSDQHVDIMILFSRQLVDEGKDYKRAEIMLLSALDTVKRRKTQGSQEVVHVNSLTQELQKLYKKLNKPEEAAKYEPPRFEIKK